MQPVTTTSMVRPENLELWANSEDYFLKELAERYVGLPFPDEKELIEILTFLSIFAIGCREMKLDNLAETYDKRINMFVLGLDRIGFARGDYKQYVLKRKIPGMLTRIVRRAFGKAAYITQDTNRYTDVKKE